jgi:formate dehydrogenase
VITDTAKMADFHLRVRPGTDAWCLAAAAVLVQENLCEKHFSARDESCVDTVRQVLAQVPVDDYAVRCGVDADLLRGAARRIAGPRTPWPCSRISACSRHNSTVCSYLNKLLWILTGLHGAVRSTAFGVRAVDALHRRRRRTPVTGAPIISGLIPGNVVPQEIATDHPDRFRAMIVESSNPAHSLADSAACRAAFEQLELLVVLDVAMTETARLAHYVLPAASQFEKPGDVLQSGFPHNTFQLRHPLFEPLEGTLPEPEIWSRLVRALGVVDESDLRRCAGPPQGLDAYAEQFFTSAATSPMIAKTLPYVLYETLGPTLPDGLAALRRCGAWPRSRLTYPRPSPGPARRRQRTVRGHPGQPVRVTFTVHDYPDDFALIGHDDHKIHLELPEMIDAIRALPDTRRN